MRKIRTLKADEIEVRPQPLRNGTVVMLLYIDSRAAVELLDETYGMENWTIEYKDVAGQIYGRLSIYDEQTNRWVFREDTGAESNVEKEKGLASDILKRCLARFGCTSLYSAPRIHLEDDGYGNVGYKVSHIEYNEKRNITELIIVDKFGNEKFNWSASNPQIPTLNTIKSINKEPTKTNLQLLTDFCKIKTAAGENRIELGKFFKYYKDKSQTWKGKFNVEQLYNKWQANDKAA